MNLATFLACLVCARWERGCRTPEATTGFGTVGVSETLQSCVCQAGRLSGRGHLVSVLWKEATANLVAEHCTDSLSSGSGAGVQRGPAAALLQPRHPSGFIQLPGAPTRLGPRPLPRPHIRPLTFPLTPAP